MLLAKHGGHSVMVNTRDCGSCNSGSIPDGHPSSIPRSSEGFCFIFDHDTLTKCIILICSIYMIGLNKFLKKQEEVQEAFKEAQNLKDAGDEEVAKKIIDDLKQKSRPQKFYWVDFAEFALFSISIIFSTIFLAWFNVTGIYRDLYFWPFWLLMILGILFAPFFIKMTIEHYKLMKKRQS